MKDLIDMSLNEMSLQELEDFVEKNFDQLIRGLREAERRTCDAACETQSPEVIQANALLTQALGHVYLGKGAATMGGAALPGVTVNFGGK